MAGGEADTGDVVRVPPPVDRAAIEAARSAGRMAAARALESAAATRPGWLGAEAETPSFGPDLRRGRRDVLVTFTVPVAGTLRTALDGTEQGPQWGLTFTLGLEAWDLVELYLLLGGSIRHPLEEAPEGFSRTNGIGRAGLGTRVGLFRLDDFRLYAGYDAGYASAGLSGETGSGFARWHGIVHGPLAGVRHRLFEHLDGRAGDVYLELGLELENWIVSQSETTPGILDGGASTRVLLSTRLGIQFRL